MSPGRRLEAIGVGRLASYFSRSTVAALPRRRYTQVGRLVSPRSSSVRPRIGKGGERSVRAISRTIRSLSLFISLSLSPENLPRVYLARIDATREGRIERRHARVIFIVNATGWKREKGKQGYRRRRVKKKGGRGEVGCSQAERERVTVSLPIVRGAAASGAQKHSLRTVTPRYRATCANHWTVPLGHPCQSRAFVRSVYFVARPNIHVARCPRFSCASTSYFVRFPRIDIVFVYRRLLYINIYIFVFVFASFVLSLALPRVCSSIPCRSIGNRLSVKLVTSWVIFCAAFRTVSNLVSNTRHGYLRNRSLGVNVSLISESIDFFSFPRV